MFQNRDNIDYEIVLVLLKEKAHLRDIARSLNAPHSTVQRRLKKLANENILDYKREGKNKVFFIKNNLQARNYVLNAERHKLVRLIREYPELSIILEDILKKTGEMVILFGSYARFAAKKDSDIDIYIDTNNRKVKEEVESINSRIKVKLGKFDNDSPLVKEIIKNHVILKGAERFYERRIFE